jgi:hypothetical protein
MWLLDFREQRLLRRLAPHERAEYERRFWIASNPLWLTEPNERWVEHMARHAVARLLREAPRGAGAVRWGDDRYQLTVRYGTPASRAQVRGHRAFEAAGFVEYYDTAQRAYSPERWLADGFPQPPLPGEAPPLYAGRSRSGYALRTVSRVVDLPHQLTRFVSGTDVVLRVDAALRKPDGADEAATEVRLGLFAYDSAFTRRVQSVTAQPWAGDSLRFSLLVRMPATELVYSVEALDSVAGFAARARYALPASLPDEGPIVSDLLIALPFEEGRLPSRRDDPALRPRPSLEVAAGETLGVYAEVYRIEEAGADRLRVELALEPADRPGLLTQLGRWIGRATGITGPRIDPRVAWQTAAEDAVYPLALNLPLDPRRHGRHELVLRVTDLRSGLTAETRRPLLIHAR